jgi:uncharacterized protein (DUF433 family)
MKRNNSFRVTFYLGLCVILFIVSFLTTIIVNVWRVLEPRLKPEKVEVVTEQYPLDTEKIHDTIFIEKSSPKITDSPKVSKKQVSIVETQDTVVSVDTLK